MSKYEYKIGYGKPPKSNRFKKGESGNPKGRPKKAKNMLKMLSEELDVKCVKTEDGRTLRLKRGIIRKTARGALNDTKQMDQLIKMIGLAEKIAFL